MAHAPLPSIEEILQSAQTRALQGLQVTSPEPGPTRFPVVVKVETRHFLNTYAEAYNTSIAALAGLILDTVAAGAPRKEEAQ